MLGERFILLIGPDDLGLQNNMVHTNLHYLSNEELFSAKRPVSYRRCMSIKVHLVYSHVMIMAIVKGILIEPGRRVTISRCKLMNTTASYSVPFNRTKLRVSAGSLTGFELRKAPTSAVCVHPLTSLIQILCLTVTSTPTHKHSGF